MKRTSDQTKLEGFSQDDKKKVKATNLENFEKIEEEMVTTFGKFGRCNAPKHSSCPQRFPAETAEIFDKVLCKECAIELYGTDTVSEAVFHPSDATFRCPAFDRERSCKSEAVSYSQFFMGSCCEPALRWRTNNEKGQKVKLQVVEKVSNKTRIELQKSKETSERLAKETQDREEKLQRDQKNLEKLEKSIAQSKKNITDKNIKLIALKKTRKDENNLRESASRRMHLLSFEYFDAAKKIEQDESKSGNCPMCGIVYDDNIVMDQKCKLDKCSNQCGFSACFHCLEDIICENEDEDEDEDGISVGECLGCGEIFQRIHIIKA